MPFIKRVRLLWTKIKNHHSVANYEHGRSQHQFFVYHLLPSIAESDLFAVEAVFVGKDKQSLDEADANLNLVQVTTLFGSYIK